MSDSETDTGRLELLAAARAAREQAHCPYSNYAVGAAIRAPSGAIYSGCNVENAAYPEGTCAEAGAIAAMVLAGELEIVEVAVVTDGETPGTPCGGCRQRLSEFASPRVLIHAATIAATATATATTAGDTGGIVTISMADLLPTSFGPEQLP